METLAMIKQAFGEERMSCTRVFEWNARFGGDRRKVRQVNSKAKSMLIFSDISGIVHKEFILAGQTVNSTYCCDVLQRMCESV
jgi:hypothetical protein